MAELLLINPNTGNPYLTASKKIPKNAKAKDYINIIILFVDYKIPAFAQFLIANDRKAIVQQLYQTYPFNAYRGKLNIFTPKIQPDLGVVYSSNSSNSGFAFKKSIKNQIKKYSYQSFIKNGDVWLRDKNYQIKRSEGCVGIVSGDRSQKKASFRRYRSPARRPDTWAINLGAIKQRIGHFLIASKKSGNTRKIKLPSRFIHELGHSLNLADEYEGKIKNNNNNGIWTAYKGKERPNVISKNDISKTTGPVSLGGIILEGVFPVANAIDNTKIPWEIMLGDFQGVSALMKLKLLNLNEHNSRNISRAACTGSDVNGRPLTKNGPFTYDSAHGWCKRRTPTKINSSTTKDASTELSIGLYEGGDTKSFDIFRPQSNCRMRYSSVSNGSYCWVCQKWILYRISAPVFKRTVSDFKKWLNNDLLVQLELVIRNDNQV